MNKFQVLDCLGTGTYGVVNRALNLDTNEIVAIKTMNQSYGSYEECLKLKEVKILIKLKEHPNIVKLKNIHFEGQKLHLIFEYLENNIYQLYTNQKPNEKLILKIIYQLADALAYMHAHGYFHRDLKPENILIDQEVVKLIDFGLCKDTAAKNFTDYVSTRWYRAPEVLLHATTYGPPIDMFALGCIMCELYLGKPLFMGDSEQDQFYKQHHILGTFTQQEWPEGHNLMLALGINLHQQGSQLWSVIKQCSGNAFQLVAALLKWNPAKRITAAQVLQHPCFVDEPEPPGTPEFAKRTIHKSNTYKK